MTLSNQTWTRAHDLALIYIALAYGADQELSDDELATITDALQEWRANFPVDEVQDVVMEALTVYLDADADEEVVLAIDSLKDQLSQADRRRAIEDVVRIAEADGVLLSTERNLINRVAEAWEIKSIAEQLLEASQAAVETGPDWSYLHDIGLTYLIMAHTSDEKITEPEIAAMIERLNAWQSNLTEPEIRTILRSALTYYSRGLGQEEVEKSVRAIREKLSVVHRLVLLDDLLFIGQSDGAISNREKELLEYFSLAWDVSIRVNGEAPKSK